MNNEISSKSITQRGKLLSIVLIAMSLTFVTPVNAADELLNPGFESNLSGWTGALQTGQGNSACSGGMPNIGTWESGKLSFSYVRNTVFQDVEISVPSLVTIFFDVQNRGDQALTQWFSASLGESTTGNFTPGYIFPESKSITVRTYELKEVLRVAFRGQDQLWWAGCYGTRVSNLSFVVDKNTTVKPVGHKFQERSEGAELRLGKLSSTSKSK